MELKGLKPKGFGFGGVNVFKKLISGILLSAVYFVGPGAEVKAYLNFTNSETKEISDFISERLLDYSVVHRNMPTKDKDWKKHAFDGDPKKIEQLTTMIKNFHDSEIDSLWSKAMPLLFFGADEKSIKIEYVRGPDGKIKTGPDGKLIRKEYNYRLKDLITCYEKRESELRDIYKQFLDWFQKVYNETSNTEGINAGHGELEIPTLEGDENTRRKWRNVFRAMNVKIHEESDNNESLLDQKIRKHFNLPEGKYNLDYRWQYMAEIAKKGNTEISDAENNFEKFVQQTLDCEHIVCFLYIPQLIKKNKEIIGFLKTKDPNLDIFVGEPELVKPGEIREGNKYKTN